MQTRLYLLAAVVFAGCATDPQLGTDESALSQHDVDTLNRIGATLGMQFAWTAPPDREGVANLDVAVRAVDGLSASTTSDLGDGTQHTLTLGPGAIDPCWFSSVGVRGEDPLIVAKGGDGNRDINFGVTGANYTIEGVSTPDPNTPAYEVHFVVRDGAGNVVFESK